MFQDLPLRRSRDHLQPVALPIDPKLAFTRNDETWTDAFALVFDHWLLPYLWLLFVPLLTVALTRNSLSSLRYDSLDPGGPCTALGVVSEHQGSWRCPVAVGLIAYAPGVLNMVPLLWLLSARPVVRGVATVAGLFGVARLLVPFAHARGISGSLADFYVAAFGETGAPCSFLPRRPRPARAVRCVAVTAD